MAKNPNCDLLMIIKNNNNNNEKKNTEKKSKFEFGGNSVVHIRAKYGKDPMKTEEACWIWKKNDGRTTDGWLGIG